jgi:hypothetical protein
MKRSQWTLTATALLIMLIGAGALWQMKAHQRLGKPGVLTRPLPDSRNEEVLLPERVLDYQSQPIPTDKLVIEVLPADTCFGTRHYKAADEFEVLGSVVLMGSDRTSLHKPEYCLRGAGWQIVSTERITIPIKHPHAYELPASKIIVTRQQPGANGQPTTLNGVYIYWYVADKAISGDPTGAERMWSMARKLLQTGELQRWAYVTFLAPCPPGREAATDARLREFIAAAVPDFQITQPEKEIADGRKD